MCHVILLGDSIFDNARYVPGGPAVIEQLRRCLPSGWKASLLARDGAYAEDVVRQMDLLPDDATHLVVSAGGNDALGQSGLVHFEPAQSFAEVLSRMAAIHDDFTRDYRAMLACVLRRGLPTAVCTVYDSIPRLERAEYAGLCFFDDVILREAFAARVPVIDLRLICTDASDYSSVSPIEPSVAGGWKIAQAVSRLVTSADIGASESRVFS